MAPRIEPDAGLNQQFKDDLLARIGELRLACFKGSGPSGPGRVFDSVADADAWADDQNADWNVYVHANPGTSDARNCRLAKQGTTRLAAHVVDLDPPKGSKPESWPAWRDRALAAIADLPMKPTYVVDSGRGLQIWWVLSESENLRYQDPDAPTPQVRIDSVESRAKALGAMFGDLTDDVAFTIDHVWRWPGTRNLKAGAGVAEVIEANDAYYEPRDFPVPTVEPTDDTELPSDWAAPEGWKARRSTDGLHPKSQRTIALIQDGFDFLAQSDSEVSQDEALAATDRSTLAFNVACDMLRGRHSPADIFEVLMADPLDLGIGHYCFYRRDPEKGFTPRGDRLREREARRCVAKALDVVPDRLLDPTAADRSARMFQSMEYPHLIHTARFFVDYVGPNWQELEDGTVRQNLQEWLRDAEVACGKDGAKRKPFPINNNTKTNVMGALEDLVHRPTGTYTPPCWLTPAAPFPAKEIVACRNKLVNVRTGETMTPTPDFFTFVAAPFDYQPELGEDAPPALQAFMDSIWPDNPELQDLMQEVVGYLMLPVNRYQKMFLLLGASRGGKGTWVRLIQALLGRGAYTTATANSLGHRTGLSSFPTAGVAFLPDIRLGQKTDTASLMERLLGITGGDELPVERKYRDEIPMRLNTRLVLLANETPRWPDGYGALANRTIPVPFTESFLGREDPDLDAKLQAEVAQVFNWALAGLRRLLERDRFDLPDVSLALLDKVRAETGGVEAFLKECCEIDHLAETDPDEMYRAYADWADGKGIRVDTKEWFGRRMRDAARDRFSFQRSSTIPRWVGIKALELPF